MPHESIILGKNHEEFLKSLGFYQKIKADNHCVFRTPNDKVIIDHIVSPNDDTRIVLRMFFINFIKLLKVNNRPMEEIASLIPIQELNSNGKPEIVVAGEKLEFDQDWHNQLPTDQINRWWLIFDFAFNLSKKI
ncbi:hypothetical protein EHI8A_067210 [Entamoeba histolytica HM-1:IMSS-B]|uniref:Uncharacterized protein n=6 Tax=Entamoeba histolytica TaxID=5759 RepID=C4M9Y8_ENTH1|nr:hypothetical protein EHI_131500 [Entamoeba histolytica HM-1:IMSS]EMD45447.1 Hypothetical protein EHI5A_098350 [Entamoeba histolytica KU27]EMH76742.1 hypothetical protein EHI8A_067210 [Entamoeba histolytica HM-1:IMSS-B]EMS16075.1 hypothetical protein KM1_123370 [Entamoeba histolytica HM-3:IMSS]ENY62607.1 hypothetical protein EHI7A_064300 [Entamoeba histolytica HM-1:IMSS-A]GAT98547.1 hypothetical protein CL6EHI_131500 [Entamoeba histolytica]|eukprot:XP_649378.1 hypothetical protein EHI_131500 [Entamoeba histolytica HM-1:IMSS]